jgi:hypothetical protein
MGGIVDTHRTCRGRTPVGDGTLTDDRAVLGTVPQAAAGSRF